MTPEEKAKEIMDKYRSLVWGNTFFTRNKRLKEAAIICVDEIIDSWSKDDGLHFHVTKKYWQKVKEEIKNQ